jgi:hypothetical protein
MSAFIVSTIAVQLLGWVKAESISLVRWRSRAPGIDDERRHLHRLSCTSSLRVSPANTNDPAINPDRFGAIPASIVGSLDTTFDKEEVSVTVDRRSTIFSLSVGAPAGVNATGDALYEEEHTIKFSVSARP